jgi:hypothetical protein
LAELSAGNPPPGGGLRNLKENYGPPQNKGMYPNKKLLQQRASRKREGKHHPKHPTWLSFAACCVVRLAIGDARNGHLEGSEGSFHRSTCNEWVHIDALVHHLTHRYTHDKHHRAHKTRCRMIKMPYFVARVLPLPSRCHLGETGNPPLRPKTLPLRTENPL